MDVESQATIDEAVTRLQTVGETLIASLFGNATKFVDETLPKVEATAGRIISRLSLLKIGVIG